MIDLEPIQHAPRPEEPKRWPMLLTIFVVLVSLIGVAYLVTAEPDDAPEAVTPTSVDNESPSTEPEDALLPEDPAVTPPPIEVETPTFVAGEEPIADAAELILPSVVQISTGGGVGSGVIYDADGLILTAAHVVEGQDTVTVRFQDGEQMDGMVVGGNADVDVAVVQVDRTGLPAASLALGEAPRVGQLAIAVGSPWGLDSTVTAGIVSAINQPLCDTVTCQAMLQTDAAINPGNSGGALVDRQGRVVGINVSIFTLSGANDGVGFAVPIDVAFDIADRLVSGESLAAAYLGVTGEPVESGQAGAFITEVQPGTGAEAAGLEVGDLVIEMEGVPIQGIDDLASQVRRYRPGTIVEVVVVRDGSELAFDVTLGERPEGS